MLCKLYFFKYIFNFSTKINVTCITIYFECCHGNNQTLVKRNYWLVIFVKSSVDHK
jgi:hypothetical protein